MRSVYKGIRAIWLAVKTSLKFMDVKKGYTKYILIYVYIYTYTNILNLNKNTRV